VQAFGERGGPAAPKDTICTAAGRYTVFTDYVLLEYENDRCGLKEGAHAIEFDPGAATIVIDGKTYLGETGGLQTERLAPPLRESDMDAGLSPRLDPAYWEHISETDGWIPKSGIAPSDAIEWYFSDVSPAQWCTECFMSTQASFYKGLLDTIGKTSFDDWFVNHQADLRISIGGLVGSPFIRRRIESEAELKRGDWVYFQNWVTAQQCPQIANAQGENTIVQSETGTKSFIGLGVPDPGQPGVTGQQVLNVLDSYWRQTTCPKQQPLKMLYAPVTSAHPTYFANLPIPVGTLQDGIPVRSLSGARGSMRHFTFTVPPGALAFTVTTSLGSGECDLYLMRDRWASRSLYALSSRSDGTAETITVDENPEGTWYVLLDGRSHFPGVTLEVSFLSPVLLENDVPEKNVGGDPGSLRFYKFTVPPGQSSSAVSTKGGSGDCDPYVRAGAAASLSRYDYRPYLTGNKESVIIPNPVAGDWYVLLHGFSCYSGVTLRVKVGTARALVRVIVSGPAEVLENGTAEYVGIAYFTDGSSTQVTHARWWSEDSPYASMSSGIPGMLLAGSVPYDQPLTVTARFTYAGVTRTDFVAAVIRKTTPAAFPLQNKIALENLSGAAGNAVQYKITVPPGKSNLVVSTAGDQGNCDIYMKFGSPASTLAYDHAALTDGNEESALINAQPGDWYILLYGHFSYSGVRLNAVYSAVRLLKSVKVSGPSEIPEGTARNYGATAYFSDGSSIDVTAAASWSSSSSCASFSSSGSGLLLASDIAVDQRVRVTATYAYLGVSKSGTKTTLIRKAGDPPLVQEGEAKRRLSGLMDSETHFKLSVPPGESSLIISITGGSGNCDLYVKFGQAASTSNYDYHASRLEGNGESITVITPQSGDWHILLYGDSSYSGVTLSVGFEHLL
jgi:hypothetical protein